IYFSSLSHFLFFFPRSVDPPSLPSFPTRRSSDLDRAFQLDPDLAAANVAMGLASESLADTLKYLRRAIELDPSYTEAYHQVGDRSEEHTSELQSHLNLVCRLLLEKKKNNNVQHTC